MATPLATLAGKAADVLQAGSGNETLLGGLSTGANTFDAGSGNDMILGGLGNDTIQAGTGNATEDGSFGHNLFLFVDGQAGGVDSIGRFRSVFRQQDQPAGLWRQRRDRRAEQQGRFGRQHHHHPVRQHQHHTDGRDSPDRVQLCLIDLTGGRGINAPAILSRWAGVGQDVRKAG